MKKRFFTPKDSVCSLDSLVDEVKGIPSNSASPSDIWLIKFKDDTHYVYEDKEIPIKSAFMKIFVDPDNTVERYVNQRMIDALNYELKVYRDIIRPLLDLNICNNYIKYLSSGMGCTYDNLLDFLVNGKLTSKDGVSLNKTKAINNLNANLNNIYFGNPSREAINDTYDMKVKYAVPKEVKYNIIMNEQIKNSYTLYDFLFADKTLKPEEVKKGAFELMFQIAYACYCMSLSKMNHNDIHAGNIFVTKHEKAKVYEYWINGESYKIKTKYFASVYDFDRAYTIRLGKNTNLEGDACTFGYQCNVYVENKDIVKMLCYICASRTMKDVRSKVIKMVSKNKFIRNTLSDSYRSGCFFREIGRNPEDITKFLNKCFDTLTILNSIYQELPDVKGEASEVVYCSSGFFDKDGKIDMKKYKIYVSTLYKKLLDSDEPIVIPKTIKKKIPGKADDKKLDLTQGCPSGKIRNPDTNRCVNRDGAIGQKIIDKKVGKLAGKPNDDKPDRKPPGKPEHCPSGKILNPETGKCVKRDGAIGKKILKDVPKKVDMKDCPSGKIRNPATGRCVNIDGAVGKKILADLKKKV